MRTSIVIPILALVLAGMTGTPLQGSARELLTIQNILVETTDTQAVIRWNSNLIANRRVDYGTSGAYDFFITNKDPDSLYHTVVISNLRPNTRYHFSVTSANNEQSTSSFDRTFYTKKGPVDRHPPKISSVNAVYVTGTSATIQWKTDEDTSARIRFGTSPRYDKSVAPGGFRRLHDVTLKGLRVSTTYHYQIVATDREGNVSTYSDLSFRTLDSNTGELDAFRFSFIMPASANDPSIGERSVVVSWRTNKLATGAVLYGKDAHTKIRIKEESVRAFEHSVTLHNLNSNTVYYYRVESTDVFGIKSVSDLFSFRTRATSIPEQTGVQTGIHQQKKTQTQGASNTMNKAPKKSTQTTSVRGYMALPYSKPSALYQDMATGHLYAIVANQKISIPGDYWFSLYGYSREDVAIVSSQTINSIPNIQYVRADGSPTVYRLYKSQYGTLKLPIPNESVFRSYPDNAWSKIVVLDQSSIDQYPTATLIRTNGSEKVYRVEGGMKRPIADQKVFYRFGFNPSDVVIVSDQHLNFYTTGETIG